MNRKKGFTLLEVMVALAIIAIGVSSILDSMAWDAVIPFERKMRYKGVQLSELIMHKVEIDIAKNGFPEDDVENKGDFKEEELSSYHWIERRKKIEIPDDIGMLSKLFMGSDQDEEGNVNPKAGGIMAMAGPLIQIIKDVFEASIREIEIEIYWFNGDPDEKGSRESFILTTHLIDFRKMKSMPNLARMFGGSSNKSRKTNTRGKTSFGKTTITPGVKR
jgi:prepilin-type N-terminal cleavage/methylation domain-containing protein